MSVRAQQWAWEKGRELDLREGLRFLLVRIADHADNDGVCWPGIESIADYLGCDESTVRRRLGELADPAGLNLLHRERRAPKGRRGRRNDAIVLHLEEPAQAPDDLPGALHGRSEGDLPGAGARNNRALVHDLPGAGACPIYPEPSGTPSEPTHSLREDQGKGGEVLALPRVSGRQVTAEEWRLAGEIVATFNRTAGTEVTLRGHYKPIIGRVREFPALTADEHRGIVDAVFAGRHWWEGRPTPAVIYGNRAQFERSIEQWRARGSQPLSGDGTCSKRQPHVGEPRPDDPPETRSAEVVWAAAVEHLDLPDSTRALWIDPIVPLEVRDRLLVLAAPDSTRTWVERRYIGAIVAAVREVSTLEGIDELGAAPDERSEAA